MQQRRWPWWWPGLLAAVQLRTVVSRIEELIGEIGGGSVALGTPLTLSEASPGFVTGRAMSRTIEMYLAWLNNERGGIFVGGEYLPVSVHLVDDLGSDARATDAARELLDEGVRLFLGPMNNELTRYAADVVHAGGGTMVAPAATTHGIFKDRPQVFGAQSPARRAFPNAFAEVAATPHPPRSVAFFSEDSLRMRALCSEVRTHAAAHGMRYLDGVSVGLGQSPAQAVSWLKAQQPDLVVGCTDAHPRAVELCREFLLEARRQELNPKATIMEWCVSSPSFFEEVGDASRWVLGVVPWTSSKPFASIDGYWTASNFAERYASIFLEDPPLEAAGMLASCTLLVEAIERANSTEPAPVAAALRSLQLPTILGDISFDQDGQSMLDWPLVQIGPLMKAPLRIKPAPEMSFLYPTPPWAERACSNNDEAESSFGYRADGSCGLCPEVSAFNETVLRRICEACPAGEFTHRYLNGNTSYCQAPCQPGSAGKECVPCRQGYYEVDDACQLCPLGRFTFTSGSTACAACPQGSFANRTGSSQCALCSSGTSLGAAGGVACVPCPFGKNASRIGTTDCALCKQGWVARTEGMSHCEPCPVGTQSVWGAQDCELCPLYTFQSVEGSSPCLPDGPGQRSIREGTVHAMNMRGYWARSENEVERCMFEPSACLEMKRCAEGHTGRQCLACLPSHSRGRASCFRCPNRLVNVLITVCIAALSVLGLLLFARFAISSFGRAQDTILIVLCKQLVNHCVTMSICCVVLSNILREHLDVIEPGHSWLAELFALPLSLYDGCLPSESWLWSISCLMQPGVGQDVIDRLATAKHTDYFNASLASDLEALRSSQAQTEIGYVVFWLLVPVAYVFVCDSIGYAMLHIKLSRNQEFYLQAFDFYKDVKDHGFKVVMKKYMERRRREYVSAYFSRINGIWSPANHVLRLLAARRHKQLSLGTNMVNLRLFREESTITKAIGMFIVFVPVCRALVRPIRCLRVGESPEERLVFSQSAVTCSGSEPLVWVAACCASLWCIVFPVRIYFRLWKVHNQIHLPEYLREYGFLVCGYKWDFWWWEPVVYIRKALCCMIEAMPFISEKDRRMLFQVLSIGFFVLEFSLHPYDDRCADLFHRLELQQLGLFVLSIILLKFLDESLETMRVSVAAMVIPALLFLMHVLYVGYVVCKILSNLLSLMSGSLEKSRFRSSAARAVQRYLLSKWNATLRASSYVSYDPLYGWLTICGSRGDVAAPPYVPKGYMARCFKGGRPKLSQAPSVPENTDGDTSQSVALANYWQRTEVHRILSMAVRHITASHESGPVFSLSILEFVIRAAFVMCKESRLPGQASAGPEDVDSRVLERADRMRDPIELKRVPPAGQSGNGETYLLMAMERFYAAYPVNDDAKRCLTECSQDVALKAMAEFNPPRTGDADHSALLQELIERLNAECGGRSGDHGGHGAGLGEIEGADEADSGGEKSLMAQALLMEEELHKVFSVARGGGKEESPVKPSTRGSSNTSRRNFGSSRNQEPETDGLELAVVDGIKRGRYSALLHEMFSPALFRRGVTVLNLQFALMQLQSLPREDLQLWLDLFEERWLHERAAATRKLGWLAGHVVDASWETVINTRLLKCPAGSHSEEVTCCDAEVQAAEGFRAVEPGPSLRVLASPDPSLRVALRWLGIVTEVLQTVSIASLRRTMRPKRNKRDALMRELRQLQEAQQQDEARIRELQAAGAASGAATTAP